MEEILLRQWVDGFSRYSPNICSISYWERGLSAYKTGSLLVDTLVYPPGAGFLLTLSVLQCQPKPHIAPRDSGHPAPVGVSAESGRWCYPPFHGKSSGRSQPFFRPGAPGVEVFQRGKVKVQVFRNHSLTTKGQPGGEKKVVSSSESKGFCDFSIYDWGVAIYETTGDELGIHCL